MFLELTHKLFFLIVLVSLSIEMLVSSYDFGFVIMVIVVPHNEVGDVYTSPICGD